MYHHSSKMQHSAFNRLVSAFAAFAFIVNLNAVPLSYAGSTVLGLPQPGTMVKESGKYEPSLIKGIGLYPDNPLRFDFIVDPGDAMLSGQALKDESERMIRYFLAAMTVPDEELWVNLSPYEKDKIIAKSLGQTEMGRDMLAQDYLLKQLTASMMYPEDNLGKAFWKRVMDKAYQKFGTTQIPVNTFNKIWIMPAKAVVLEENGQAFVVESRLKVMLEEDYLTLQKNLGNAKFGMAKQPASQTEELNQLSSQVVREVLLPEIEKEVNEGKNFAQLRQVYNSLILAAWYKKNLKESLLGQVYADKGKVKGVDLEDKAIKEKIYQQYVEAFQKGVYNYMKKEYDQALQREMPRKYFSGGVNFRVGGVVETKPRSKSSPVQEKVVDGIMKVASRVTADLVDVGPKGDLARAASSEAFERRSSPVEVKIINAEGLSGKGLFTVARDRGLVPTELRVETLVKGTAVTAQDFVDNPVFATALGISVAQAMHAIPFAGQGIDGRKAGDGNAGEATHQSLLNFVRANPNHAVAILADEGKREKDGTFFLPVMRIYFSGYEGDYANHTTLADFDLARGKLADQKVILWSFAGDALEHTNALAKNAGDSWSLAAFIEGWPGNPVDDESRIAGIGFNAPSDGGVLPLDLPETAFLKIALAYGFEPGTPGYAKFINLLKAVCLGPREKDFTKLSGSDLRHKEIIESARAVQKELVPVLFTSANISEKTDRH